MNRSRIQIAKADILAHFKENESRVLKYREIGAILSKMRSEWRLAQTTNTHAFIKFLAQYADLKQIAFELPNRKEELYVLGRIPTLEMLLYIKPQSYYSHYTALRMHGLTEQIPTSIYINHERTTENATSDSNLSQAAIDEAFTHPPRITKNAVNFGDRRLIFINSAFTKHLGVVQQTVKYSLDETALVRLTNVERTLVDAAVRPFYTGGVFEVAKAFELAKEQVSINALSAMLKNLGYLYPYHQAIGYYMERAGYRSSQLDLLRRFPIEHDFYLTHEMSDPEYVKEWRLYVPQGF